MLFVEKTDSTDPAHRYRVGLEVDASYHTLAEPALDNRTMVHTVVDAQVRKAYSAGTLCRYRPRTLYAS